MTIEEYLKGAFDNDVFTDENIGYVLAKYDIDSGSLIEVVSGKQKDLALAELHLLFANKASGTGQTIQRGDFKVAERSWTLTWGDKEYHRNIARALFLKWGVDIDELPEVRHYTRGEYLIQ